MVYNSLSFDRTELVCIKTSDNNAVIRNASNKVNVPSQINPVVHKDRSRMEISKTVFEVRFFVFFLFVSQVEKNFSLKCVFIICFLKNSNALLVSYLIEIITACSFAIDQFLFFVQDFYCLENFKHNFSQLHRFLPIF